MSIHTYINKFRHRVDVNGARLASTSEANALLPPFGVIKTRI